jgi:hypothetical protein
VIYTHVLNRGPKAVRSPLGRMSRLSQCAKLLYAICYLLFAEPPFAMSHQATERGQTVWPARSNVTVNTLPCPSWLSTEIAPPCASINSLAMAKPNPVLTPLRDTSPR